MNTEKSWELMGAEEALDYQAIQSQIKFLQGKVLTIIDASFQNERQLKSVKDLVNKAFSEQLTWVMQLCYPEVQIMSKDQADALLDTEDIEKNAEVIED